MKITKRILCLALSVMMALGCMSIAAFADDAASTTKDNSGAIKFSDVGDSEIYTDAVKTLNLMGVINGYPDGTFKPNDNVTRAEFTAMLMRTLKLGSIGSTSAAELPFSDVDDNNSDINWAIPNINTAYARGVINGYEDGTFRPSANVAYEEAVKMIVCTLGYGANVDVSITPWYANFIQIGSQLGITKTAQRIGAAETPASRACIAQLLYDSLDVKLIENGEKTDRTILNSYLGYVKNTGVISSNQQTSLTEPDVNLRDDEIRITAREENGSEQTYTYKTADTSLKNYLGYEVDFYYKDNSSSIRELAMCMIKSTEPLVINSKSIESSGTTANQIKYYQNLDDDKEKTINLESDNVVIYNGKLSGSNANNSRFSTDLIPAVGEIKLIDSDNNGRYDVLDITSYDVYYVSSKAAATYEVVDNMLHSGENNKVKLDVASDDNLTIVNKNGSTVNFSSIATGNVVCVAASKSDNGGTVITRAVVLTDKVTGTVSGTSGNDKITISNKEYRFSDLAPWVKDSSKDAPKMQDSGTFYLDINGDIVAFSKNATSDNMKYGYIVSVNNSDDPFESDVALRIRSASGSEERVWTYKSTRVNGESANDGYDVLNKIKTAAGYAAETDTNNVQQLVKYSTKTSGGKTVLDKIVTLTSSDVKSSGGEVSNDKLTRLDTVDNKTFKYNSSSGKLTSEDGKTIITLTSSVIVFNVPKSRSDYDDFSKTSVSSTFKNNGTYNIEVYDVSTSNVPKVVVALGQDSTQAVNSASPVYVLTEKSQGTNDDGTMDLFKGFKSSPDSAKSTFSDWISTSTSSSVIDDMTEGDIYRAGTDKDGYSTIESKDILYKYEGNNSSRFGIKQETTNGDSSSDMYSHEFVAILGSVTAKDVDESTSAVNTIAVSPKEMTERNENYVVTDDLTFSASDFSGAQVLVYNTDSQKLKIESESVDAALAQITSVHDGNPTKVLIYMSEGKIKMLCILPA